MADSALSLAGKGLLQDSEGAWRLVSLHASLAPSLDTSRPSPRHLLRPPPRLEEEAKDLIPANQIEPVEVVAGKIKGQYRIENGGSQECPNLFEIVPFGPGRP